CGPFWGFATDTVPPPMPSPCETSPRPVPGIQDAMQVTVGGHDQCVVHRDASATRWGSNAFGELGALSRPVTSPVFAFGAATPPPGGGPVGTNSTWKTTCAKRFAAGFARIETEVS